MSNRSSTINRYFYLHWVKESPFNHKTLQREIELHRSDINSYYRLNNYINNLKKKYIKLGSRSYQKESKLSNHSKYKYKRNTIYSKALNYESLYQAYLIQNNIDPDEDNYYNDEFYRVKSLNIFKNLIRSIFYNV